MNMWTPLLLIALCITPYAPQSTRTPPVEGLTVDQQLHIISEWLELTAREAKAEFRASIEKLENATNHLVQELDIVRSRQAASAAVQASQVIMMVTYLLTIICTWGLSRCQKVSEKAKRKEFERLEMQLRSSKARRRAAAAQEKSAQAQSLE